MPGKGRRSRREVIVTDDRAKLMLTFFSGRSVAVRASACSRPGMVGMFAGTVSSFRGRRQLVHPECEMLPGAPPNADLTPELAAEFAAEMIPVYPASAKFSSWIDRQVGPDRAGHAGRRGGSAARAGAGARTGCAGRPRRSAPSTGRWTRRTGTGPGSG